MELAQDTIDSRTAARSALTVRPSLGEAWFLRVSVAWMAVYYATVTRLFELNLFQPGSANLFRPAPFGMTFNSMFYYLLAGRFDIDRAAIGTEAFIVDGKAVAYFGIFCALLRAPLAPFLDLIHTDVTRLSCLVAICIGGYFQLRGVLLVRRCVARSPRSDILGAALIACILLGGQQVQFLRPTVYQEVIDWADTLAMIFVYLATRGLVSGSQFSRGLLAGMAACAGCALLTRVSTGLGLYVALGGLLLVLAWRDGLLKTFKQPAWPILFLAVVVAAIVNYGRWGNPLIFADFSRYGQILTVVPEWLTRQTEYGEFNIRRLWFGLSYYFLPIWTIVRGDGRLLFEDTQDRLINNAELPAGSFLLSDPLLLALAIVGLVLLIRRARTIDHLSAVALLVGLAVPPLLMLTAISMNFRYRMEFYPFLVLSALLAYRLLCREGAKSRLSWPSVTAIVTGVVISIITSHAMAALYIWSPWGTGQRYLAPYGWSGVYGPPLHELMAVLRK